MKLQIPAFALAVIGLSASFSNATTLGLTDYSGYAQHSYWDTFGSTIISNQAPGNTAGFSSVGLSQSSAGSPPYGPYTEAGGATNDLFYDFTNGTTWDINFTSTSSVPTLVLQIKGANPAVGTLSAYFTPFLSIDGGSVISADVSPTQTLVPGETVFGGLPLYVATYTWSDLNALSGSVFNISMDRVSGFHEGVDAFQIAAVPEPSTYGLVGLGILAIVALHRRRARA